MTHTAENPAVRRVARLLAVVPAVLVTLAAGSASASPPEQWEDSSVSPLRAILVYLVLPVGLFLLIALLVYLPSMRKGQGYHPGEAWRGGPEWFGGPRGGVEAADRAGQPAAVGPGSTGSSDGERGGASGRW